MGLEMRKILMALSALLIIHGTFVRSAADVENRHVDTKYFALASIYLLQGSLVYGSEPDKDSCNEGNNNYFGYKGPHAEINDFVNI